MSTHPDIHPVRTHHAEHPDELPKSVEKFREIISNVKDDILSKLESSEMKGKKSSQTSEPLKDATQRIIHFGNVLMAILDNHKEPDTKIVDTFKKHGVNLLNMSYDEKKLCKHYITLDIYMNTYDVNGHASK
jgi:hypothetical protein